ncbi:MAG: hypothetical protein U0625_10415 [Phycisphaerales bacterium]
MDARTPAPRSRTRAGAASRPRADDATGARFTPTLRRRVQAEAIAFLAERYGLDAGGCDALAAVPVRWSRARGASAFYPRAAHGHAGPHIRLRVPSGTTGRWHTYRRARARFATPRGGLELPVRILATAVLIHEYTHALQHGIGGGDKRLFSEVETTGNEIEFIRRAAPEAFAQLVPVERRAGARAGSAAGRAAAGVTGRTPTRTGGRSRTDPKPASGLQALRTILLRFGAGVAGLLQPAPGPAATGARGRVRPARTPPTAPPRSPRRSRSPRPTGS